MDPKLAALASPLVLVLAVHGPALAAPTDAKIERAGPGAAVVTWTDSQPVDVYLADAPDADPAKAKLVSARNRSGRFELPAAAAPRPYILLKDAGDRTVVRVAERVVQLEQGSNFRDIGGYPAAGGKHVRWGRIYRSGATAMLTDADVSAVQSLGLKDLIDLRSSEERSLAPTRLNGVRYSAVGYSMADVLRQPAAPGDRPSPTGYARFPTLLAPQLRILFRALLAGEGPVAYNCSAGQDRTGFTTALLLTALGAPHDVIMADYNLSTTLRRPQYEMPRIDPAATAGNPAAIFFAKLQQDPGGLTPKPLLDADHRPLLDAAFAQIDRQWGSVDAYLDKELGVTPKDVAKLRAMYLE